MMLTKRVAVVTRGGLRSVGSTAAPCGRVTRALTKTGSTLNFRGLLVDVALFRRSGGAVPAAPEPAPLTRDPTALKASSMLVDEVRAELRERGLDDVGKPSAIRERLHSAREADAVPVVDVRARYAAKLRAKTGGDALPKAASVPQADAGMLSAARRAVEKHDSATASSRWRLGPPGLKAVISFAAARSMSIALMTRRDSTEQEKREVLEQLGDEFFDHVVLDDDSSSRFSGVADALQVEPSRILAFGSDMAFVREAREARMLTCLLVDDPDEIEPAKQDRVDYAFTTSLVLGEIINDLNGVSYRLPAPT